MIPALRDWDNGDLGQRAACVLASLVDYYRYSGDAWAIGPITLQADFLLEYCRTSPDHAWPRFLISAAACPGPPFVKFRAFDDS